MGRRGPKRIPRSILEARGSRVLYDRGADLEAGPGVPDPVVGMSDAAGAEWDRLVPLIEKMGIYANTDQSALVACCEAWAEYRAAVATIAAEGAVLADDHGRKYRHPACQIQDAAFKRWRSGASMFGLSPADRAGMAAPAEKKPSGVGGMLRAG